MNSVSASGEFDCRPTGGEGTILVTKHKTFPENVERTERFRKYILANYKSWEAFAMDQGHGITANDIIFVTGRDLTADFAMAACSEPSGDFAMSLTIDTSNAAPAGISTWSSWHCELPVFRNWGPQSTTPSAQNELEIYSSIPNPNPEYKQCVFLRGYRIYRRMMLLSKVMTPSAGPQGYMEDGREPSVSAQLDFEGIEWSSESLSEEYAEEDDDEVIAFLNTPQV